MPSMKILTKSYKVSKINLKRVQVELVLDKLAAIENRKLQLGSLLLSASSSSKQDSTAL